MSKTTSTDSNSPQDVIKLYQQLYDDVTKKDGKATVGHRKRLTLLYPEYQKVADNDATLLSDLDTLQQLLQKVQQVIR